MMQKDARDFEMDRLQAEIESLSNSVRHYGRRAEAAEREVERLQYWLLKLDRHDIVNDADKFAGPDEERRRDAIEQSSQKEGP